MARIRSTSPRWWGRFRTLKRFMVIVAAIPLLQFGACATGYDQILGGVTNALPSIGFQAVEGLVLLPIEIVIELATGSSGGGGSGGSSGLGGSGSSGLGGSSSGLGGLLGGSSSTGI